MLDPRKVQKVRFSDTTQAAGSFLSAYDLKITVDDRFLVEIGRFSFALLERAMFVAPTQIDGAILKVGAFCEAAKDGIIMIGANHANETLFNYAFGPAKVYPVVAGLNTDELLEPTRSTLIGDNVLLSFRSTVLSGSKIGDASVVGAGAVVSGSLPPYGIYGGVPAKLIRERFSPEMQHLFREVHMQDVCAHHTTDLPRLLGEVANGTLTIESLRTQIEYLERRPTVHLTAAINEHRSLTIGRPTAYSIGGDIIRDSHVCDNLDNYFGQLLSKDQEYGWVPDIFYYLSIS